MLASLLERRVIESTAMRSDGLYALQFLGYLKTDQDHVGGYLPQ